MSYAANGAETGQTVTTTSANGLTKTVQVDPSGAGVFDFTATSAKVIQRRWQLHGHTDGDQRQRYC